MYKCTAPYAPQSEHTLAWNDPEVGVEWPVDGLDPIISAKDAVGLALADVPAF
ncbi:MAG: dTDP-4-dehydrorhamnose 3,5-epimerase family protein [Pseudomonadota bacterium]